MVVEKIVCDVCKKIIIEGNEVKTDVFRLGKLKFSFAKKQNAELGDYKHCEILEEHYCSLKCFNKRVGETLKPKKEK